MGRILSPQRQCLKLVRPSLPIDLRGKRAFIAGIADDNGYGWAIAKSLAAAGAEILVGTWVPALNIFESSLRRGKFDASRVLPDGSLMEITKVYPLHAVYDTLEDEREDEVAESVKQDFGTIDILVHSLPNGPEQYLYQVTLNYVSLLKHFIPIMNPGGASISLTYIASKRIIPGYDGGMSSARAALESDTRTLIQWFLLLKLGDATKSELIRYQQDHVLGSCAAKAIGFIDKMIEYSLAPLEKELSADEVGNTAAFLVSPLASVITGVVVYVDNGLNGMGVGVDSPIFGKT
ncbi:hypothetical protein IFM89_039537 [Coptis chinensis]|uniref:Uncharacterized protein n=1 Tax=Coptis chinensis TaxID=261450 RepID=A0A835LH79_9MAGN|nr:hypothetical protein IFM89_039537 [Coptis chinensis]